MRKILLLVVMLVMSVGLFSGCVDVSTEDRQTEATRQLMKEVNNQIGMPNITEFYEKKMAKEIFELRDNSKLITYAYTQNLDGRFTYIGQCIGFGLPYSTQYTNPMQYTGVSTPTIAAGETGRRSWDYQVMPQADPNGLFTPTGLAATWLMIINTETGEREIMYTEPSIVVTQSKLPRRLVADWSIQGIDY